MSNIRITAAIEHYNLNSKDHKKLTQTILAGLVLPELQHKTACQYLSSWNNGKKISAFKIVHLVSICEVTGVDANFLYGMKPMEIK